MSASARRKIVDMHGEIESLREQLSTQKEYYEQVFRDGEKQVAQHKDALVAVDMAREEGLRKIAAQEAENEALLAKLQEPDRHQLQLEGKHPSPCARHCEAPAYLITERNLRRQLAAAKEENERLKARLEYRDDGRDGIYCRDQTIGAVEQQLAECQREVEQWRATSVENKLIAEQLAGPYKREIEVARQQLDIAVKGLTELSLYVAYNGDDWVKTKAQEALAAIRAQECDSTVSKAKEGK